MKPINLIAFLVIGGIIFWVTGGGALFGIVGSSSGLPDTAEAPNATFMGDEQANPFVD